MRVGGGNDRDRLSREADDVTRKQRTPERRVEPGVRRLVWQIQVVGGAHGGQTSRDADIEIADAPVRHRRANERRVQCVGASDIGDEACVARQQCRVLAPSGHVPMLPPVIRTAPPVARLRPVAQLVSWRRRPTTRT